MSPLGDTNGGAAMFPKDSEQWSQNLTRPAASALPRLTWSGPRSHVSAWVPPPRRTERCYRQLPHVPGRRPTYSRAVTRLILRTTRGSQEHHRAHCADEDAEV